MTALIILSLYLLIEKIVEVCNEPFYQGNVLASVFKVVKIIIFAGILILAIIDDRQMKKIEQIR